MPMTPPNAAPTDATAPAYADLFVGNSEMARHMRAHDWANSPLGPPAQWPESLKVALRILLTSRFEMWLGWGDGIHFFYNDAYIPTLGDKHPRALGAPMRQVWSEVWDDVADQIQAVYQRGESSWNRSMLLLLERSGYPEETYHTFSYSPLLGDSGRVEGLFCAVTEDTDRVISERRLDALRELAAELPEADSRERMLQVVCTQLGRCTRDLPFSLLYLFDSQGDASLACHAGIEAGHRLAPAHCPAGSTQPWDLGHLAASDSHRTAELPPAADLPTGFWSIPPRTALLVPVGRQGAGRPAGVLVAGLNPHRQLTTDYVDFVRLLAGQIASSLLYVDVLQTRTAERDRLRLLFEQAPSFICVLGGPSHVFELANASYQRIVGARPLVGLSVREALPELAGQGFFELLDEVYRSGTPYLGQNVGVGLQADPGSAAPVERFLDFVYQPILDDEGRSTGIFVEGYDVTGKLQAEHELRALNNTLEARIAERTRDLEAALERLRAESLDREAVEDALRQAQKMEAVGQLTGGIAHDFNNLLQGITGSLDVLSRRLQQGSAEGREGLERLVAGAMGSAQRAAGLTHRLLAFSRRQPLDPKTVDTNLLVLSMEDLLRRTMGEHIRFSLDLAPGLWPTLCDGNQLESAILNLCINARDAMPEGGALCIATANLTVAAEADGQPSELRAGDYVVVAVSDTGTGMAPDVLSKAFDPFFTTKPLGQGTGLGLSMIYGFARQSQGTVRLDSSTGRGTVARLYLPRAAQRTEALPDMAAAAPPKAPAPADVAPTEDSAILMVVEDEPVVRGLVVDVLESLGYRTVQAADGVEALRILQSDQRVDLLVSDVGLPKLNGRQMYDHARLGRPSLQVLFMTGYAETAAASSGFLQPGMELITKPFSLDQLAAKVQAMLQREG